MKVKKIKRGVVNALFLWIPIFHCAGSCSICCRRRQLGQRGPKHTVPARHRLLIQEESAAVPVETRGRKGAYATFCPTPHHRILFSVGQMDGRGVNEQDRCSSRPRLYLFVRKWDTERVAVCYSWKDGRPSKGIDGNNVCFVWPLCLRCPVCVDLMILGVYSHVRVQSVLHYQYKYETTKTSSKSADVRKSRRCHNSGQTALFSDDVSLRSSRGKTSKKVRSSPRVIFLSSTMASARVSPSCPCRWRSLTFTLKRLMEII